MSTLRNRLTLTALTVLFVHLAWTALTVPCAYVNGWESRFDLTPRTRDACQMANAAGTVLADSVYLPVSSTVAHAPNVCGILDDYLDARINARQADARNAGFTDQGEAETYVMRVLAETCMEQNRSSGRVLLAEVAGMAFWDTVALNDDLAFYRSGQPTQTAPTPVPTSEPTCVPGSSPDCPLNVNTADAAALDILPGIGATLAARIVAERTTNGPFNGCTTGAHPLTAVSGIGAMTAAEVCPFVSF